MKDSHRLIPSFVSNNRGVILFFELILTIVIGMLGLVVNSRAVNESRLVQRQLAETRAFWAAEAGVQNLVWEMNHNDCRGMHNQATTEVCSGCDQCGTGARYLFGNLDNADFGVVVDSAGTHASSRGYYPSEEAAQFSRRIDVALQRGALFGYGAFAKGQVSIGQRVVFDSYRSDRGAYGNGNRGASGNIGTNGSNAGVVVVGDGAKVNGSVVTADGGTVVSGSGSSVSGGTSSGDGVLLPDVVVPSALESSPYLGILSFGSDQSISLGTGDYKYDYLDMGDNASLTITGQVRLYLTSTESVLKTRMNSRIVISDGASLKIFAGGPIDLSGNLAVDNQSSNPSDFVVYSAYSGANGVRIEGSGEVAAAIYAPQTDVVVVKNTEVYGSIVGNTVTVQDDAAIHYDQALEESPDLGTSLSVSHWREK